MDLFTGETSSFESDHVESAEMRMIADRRTKGDEISGHERRCAHKSVTADAAMLMHAR